MSILKKRAGVIKDENGDLSPLLVDIESGTVIFQFEGDVKREVGGLLVDNSMEPETLSFIEKSISDGDFGEGVNGVLMTEEGFWKLYEYKAIHQGFDGKDGLEVSIDLNYEYNDDGDDEF